MTDQQPAPSQQPTPQPQPAQPAPGVPVQGAPVQGVPVPGYPAKPELKGLTTWLVVPVLGITILSCGVAGLPFNFAAFVVALMARSAYDRFDLERARKRLRWAKILGIIGLSLALLNIGTGITAAILSETSGN